MENNNHVIILVGICGSGKSSLGQNIADKLEVPFFDVDTYFAFENVPEGSLSHEVNLEQWLNSVENLIVDQSRDLGCVISCSILQKEHRKRLTANIDYELDWVFMNATYENVVEREKQEGLPHRSVEQLKSDFEKLEIPKRALTIDMNNSNEEIVNTILKYLARKYG